jgi:hypothetical protein
VTTATAFPPEFYSLVTLEYAATAFPGAAG